MKRIKRTGILVGLVLGIFGFLGSSGVFGPGGPTGKWSSKWSLSGTGFAQGVIINRGTRADAGTANPVPLINQPLVPDAVAPGEPDFTLTVNGTGFVSGSVVNWNGSPLATTFISGSQLTATVPASDIAAASTGSVTVVSPSPGGGPSNVVYFPVSSPTSSVAMQGSDYETDNDSPYGMVAGDFNGDGKPDLAVSNVHAQTVSIFLGNGDGTFQSHVDYAVGSGPSFLRAGDFNGDGALDLAVTYWYQDTVSILLGNGDGTFQKPTDYATAADSMAAVVGDFNGDGKLDLAVATHPDWQPPPDFITTVSILLGNGDGTFQPHVDYPVGVHPQTGLAEGDFDRDGKLDLAIADLTSSTVSILFGNGDGTFKAAIDYDTGLWPAMVATADLNGDGNLDLVVTNQIGNTVSILLNNGDGTFRTHVDYPASANPLWVTAGDFNGDGKADLAVVNLGPPGMSILLGNGDGTFQLPVHYDASLAPVFGAAADFNGDGRLDFAVASGDRFGQSHTISVLLQAPPYPVVALSPTSLSFGAQLLNAASSPQTVTLTNTGGVTLDITGIAAGANFGQTSTCGSSVAAGANCTITVIFHPSSVGTFTGTVTITDNASNSPQTVSLAGVGTAVALSPTSLDFGSQPVGTTSSSQTVTFTNHAPRALSVFGIFLNGHHAGDFAQTNTCGTSVPAGASCTISVTFTPAATGKRTGRLSVSDNGGGSPQTVILTGSGI